MATDAFGRNIDSDGRSFEEIKALVKSMASGNVGPAKKHGKGSKSTDGETLTRIEKILEEMGTNVAKEIEKIKKDLKVTADSSKGHFKAATHKGTVYFDIFSGGLLSRTLLRMPYDLNRSMTRSWAQFSKNEKKAFVGAGIGQSMAKAGAVAAGGIAGMKLGGGMMPDVTGKRQFFRDVRMTLASTQGVTGEMNQIQEEFIRINDARSEAAVDQEKFQSMYLKGLRQGIKDQKTLTKTMVKAGQLSNMIGVDTERTSEWATVWHNQLQLSQNQMFQVSRGAQQVARLTGLTGDNLAQAVESSKQFVMNMRNAGTLTTEAAKKFQLMAALAQKSGTEEMLNPIMQALSSGVGFLESTNPQTFSLMAHSAQRGGVMREMRAGTVMNDPETAKRFAEGMEESILNITSRFGVTSAKDLKGLDPDKLTRLNLALQVYGVEAGEAFHGLEQIKEASKTTSERLHELRSSFNDREKMERMSVQQTMQMRKQLSDLELDKATEIFGAFQDASDAGMSLSESLSKATSKGSIREGGGGGIGEAANIMLGELDKLEKKGFAEGVGGLRDKFNKALSSGNDNAIVASMSNIQEAIGAAQAREMRSADPQERTAMALEDIRGYMSDKAGGWLDKLHQRLGATGVIAMHLAAIVGSTASTVALLAITHKDTLTSMWNGIGGMGGIKKGAGRAMGGLATGVRGASRFIVGGAGSALSMGGGLVGAIPGLGGLGGAMGTGGSALSGLAAAGASTGPVAAAAVAIVASIGGVIQAFEAGAHAADIFGKATEEQVTISEKWSAESAGFLTGVLNTLTLGFFKDTLGPMGTWTKELAKFMNAFPPLMLAVQYTLLPFKVLWGILKGLWMFLKNAFLGVWEGLQAAFEPILEVWDYLKATLSDILAPLSGAGESFKDFGGIVGIISSTLGGVGKALGWVFKIFGQLIGAMLKIFVPIVKLIINLLKVFKPFFIVLGAIWDAFQSVLGGIGKLLDGIVNFDISMIGNALWQLITTIPNMLLDAFDGIFGSLPELFMNGIESVFVDFPTFLWESIKAAIPGAGVASSIWEGVTGWFGGDSTTTTSTTKPPTASIASAANDQAAEDVLRKKRAEETEATKKGSAELNSIEALTNRQNELLEAQNALLQEIIRALGSDNLTGLSAAQEAVTRSQTTPRHSANYYKYNHSHEVGGAHKQVIPTGN